VEKKPLVTFFGANDFHHVSLSLIRRFRAQQFNVVCLVPGKVRKFSHSIRLSLIIILTGSNTILWDCTADVGTLMYLLCLQVAFFQL
jgi:hypothetical protein